MGRLDDSATMEITGKVMVVAIVILFLVVVFVIFLHLYAKWFWWRIEEPTHPQQSRRRQRHRYVFNPGQDPVRRGLELSILRSLPLVIFQPKDFPGGLECAVCLSDAVEGEKVRLLPKCNHGFHLDCIDMWFQSYSTCPLCRSSVAPQAQCASGANNNNDLEVNIQSPEEISISGYSIESPDFPTNVLFWGDQTLVSTGGGSLEEGPSSSASSGPSSSAGARHDEMLVIDVPVQITDNLAEDQESKLPTPTRLRSLKRLLSREKRLPPNCSNGSVDV
ncbi:PREDICTED: RING-H2 finger protein ATL3 [Populus euphratica]|uniref:RING-type E3 ubiquitin transferase n=1 Tax=Populus euphratica TaxID=75702 RepID=A0AAJ6VHR3_POPEU|nr:PREDICTED: RING-H2 finger protein ATL3 [Populus euphratica]